MVKICNLDEFCCADGNKDFCSLSTMGEVWKKNFPNVIIPKNHRFSQFTTCAQLKSDLKAKTNFMSSTFSDQKKWEFLSEQIQKSKFHIRHAFKLILL